MMTMLLLRTSTCRTASASASGCSSGGGWLLRPLDRVVCATGSTSSVTTRSQIRHCSGIGSSSCGRYGRRCSSSSSHHHFGRRHYGPILPSLFSVFQ